MQFKISPLEVIKTHSLGFQLNEFLTVSAHISEGFKLWEQWDEWHLLTSSVTLLLLLDFSPVAKWLSRNLNRNWIPATTTKKNQQQQQQQNTSCIHLFHQKLQVPSDSSLDVKQQNWCFPHTHYWLKNISDSSICALSRP